MNDDHAAKASPSDTGADRAFETILVERHERVMLVRLDRPAALNALNTRMGGEIIQAVTGADLDPTVGCIVVTGSEKAFAAGADIKEMHNASYLQMYASDRFVEWERFTAVRTPIIAAVAGLALGGGCELAMMCDFILAADTARFGQPEIRLGVMPGMGGTQRLARAIGKSKAMEMCLTGRLMDAHEAERAGLVARVVSAGDLVDEALRTAATIASMSLPVAMMTKEAVNRADETTLSEGVRFERRVFHAMFATEDQREGMKAFLEKRPPVFRHR